MRMEWGRIDTGDVNRLALLSILPTDGELINTAEIWIRKVAGAAGFARTGPPPAETRDLRFWSSPSAMISSVESCGSVLIRIWSESCTCYPVLSCIVLC